MSNTNDETTHKILQSLESQVEDPGARQALQVLGDLIQVGDIRDATGVAIGRNIRMVVNQFNLPAEVVAELLNTRIELGGLDPDQYQLEALLADKTRGFVGREAVFAAIDQFLNSQASGYFVIEGDPGLGKSAILAEYMRRTGCLAHFNVRALGITTPQQFLENICTQLIADTGLPYPSLPAKATQDGAFLVRLLKEAAGQLEPGENLVIAVDALDEVASSGQAPGANILYLPPTLPDGVYFMLTRRQVDIPFVVLSPQHLYDLMAYPAENRLDAERYIRRSAARPEIQAWIDRQQMTVEAFIHRLADLSESNFMYLRHVLPEIEQGSYQSLHIDVLPRGLQGYYQDHWQRMGMTAKPLPRVKIRIIYILSEVRQPVSRPLITEFANSAELPVNDLDVQEVLDEWDEFLRELPTPEGTHYSLYHGSFQDFLRRKDVVQAAGVSVQEINALIADNLWEDLFDSSD